jgi:zeaxanthin epoxidase
MRSFLLSSLLGATVAFVARPTGTRVTHSFHICSPKDVPSARPMSTKSPEEASNSELLGLPARQGRPLKVVIAGGGVGGLTAALCMLKKGFDVTVCEKTAAFARFGGPIQFASNALSVLKKIDDELFNRVMEKFTFTGTRTCGIKDGLRADGSFRMTNDSIDYLWNPDAPADWFVKFPLKVC